MIAILMAQMITSTTNEVIWRQEGQVVWRDAVQCETTAMPVKPVKLAAPEPPPPPPPLPLPSASATLESVVFTAARSLVAWCVLSLLTVLTIGRHWNPAIALVLPFIVIGDLLNRFHRWRFYRLVRAVAYTSAHCGRRVDLNWSGHRFD